jgi:threonine/homoserine/homoserine lactone efflux protein
MDLYYDPTPFIPGFICAFFAVSLYPTMIGKDKSLNQKAIGAAVITGIMSFSCYIFMAIYDVFLLEVTLGDRIIQAIVLSIGSMLLALLITQILFNSDEESDS